MSVTVETLIQHLAGNQTVDDGRHLMHSHRSGDPIANFTLMQFRMQAWLSWFSQSIEEINGP